MHSELRRDIGVLGATMLGLGSIIGTGVFVSIGIGAEVAGSRVVIAIGLASLVAICNGLSSAQLAANHAVSGGTYEYGHRWLNPLLGFTAGWMFLCAKSASAATAALGFAGYFLEFTGLRSSLPILAVAMFTLIMLTSVVLLDVKRTSLVNTVIVSITLLTLMFFVIAGIPTALEGAEENLSLRADTANGNEWMSLLQATALMFVAYTGYGRVATLGEEVKDPRKTIPQAVIVTLLTSMVIYLCVAVIGLGTVGAEAYGEATRNQIAPLQTIASHFAVPGAPVVLAIGAMTAMLGVLLNLLLGLSRVALAMGRRRDMPAVVASVHSTSGVPHIATIVVAVIIGILILVGDVRLTWSFSAFTVLIYYALTNLCALRLKPEERLFPIWPAYVGLAACAFLAWWVDLKVLLIGVALIVAGWLWKWIADRVRKPE